MSELSVSLLVICLVAMLAGQVAHVRGSAAKLAWYRKVREWTAAEYSMAIFLVFLALLFSITGVHQLTGWKPRAPVGLLLLIATCTTAAVYLWFFLNLARIVATHKTLLGMVGTLAAVSIATASKISSDMAIAELTGMPPQELPGAQLALTFILTPIFWFVAISFLIGYVSIPATLLLLFWGIYKDAKQHKGSKFNLSSAGYVCSWVAMSYLSILLLTMSTELMNKNFYEKRLRSAISYSAFHLPPSYCGFTNLPGAGIAALRDNGAGLAIPDSERGYIFHTVSCEREVRIIEDIIGEKVVEKGTELFISRKNGTDLFIPEPERGYRSLVHRS
ncbi:hypothetical protein [Pseudomonas sp. Marseille-QA0892]